MWLNNEGEKVNRIDKEEYNFLHGRGLVLGFAFYSILLAFIILRMTGSPVLMRRGCVHSLQPISDAEKFFHGSSPVRELIFVLVLNSLLGVKSPVLLPKMRRFKNIATK